MYEARTLWAEELCFSYRRFSTCDFYLYNGRDLQIPLYFAFGFTFSNHVYPAKDYADFLIRYESAWKHLKYENPIPQTND